MAELVDAADLKSADGNVVGVQVPLPPLVFAGQPSSPKLLGAIIYRSGRSRRVPKPAHAGSSTRTPRFQGGASKPDYQDGFLVSCP